MRAIRLAELPIAFSNLGKVFCETERSRSLAALVQRKRESLRIDYDDLAMEFNCAYFARNFLKSFLYLRSFPVNPVAREDCVLDIGAGAGPFSLAARHHNPNLQTILVDRSPAQLRLAIDLSAEAELEHVGRIYDADVFDSELDGSLMRIVSYWVCENGPRLRQSPGLALAVLGKRSIVIDYPHIVADLVDFIATLGGRARHITFANQQVCPQLAPILGQRTITYGGAYIEFNG